MRDRPKLFDVIELLQDIPEEDLKKGDIGAIIVIYDKPREAYEVEFLNSDGTEKGTAVVHEEQFKITEENEE